MIDLNRYKKVGKPDSIYQSVKVKTHIPPKIPKLVLYLPNLLQFKEKKDLEI